MKPLTFPTIGSVIRPTLNIHPTTGTIPSIPSGPAINVPIIPSTPITSASYAPMPSTSYAPMPSTSYAPSGTAVPIIPSVSFSTSQQPMSQGFTPLQSLMQKPVIMQSSPFPSAGDRNGKKWTSDEEQNLIILNNAGISFENISLQLGRTAGAVKARLAHHAAMAVQGGMSMSEAVVKYRVTADLIQKDMSKEPYTPNSTSTNTSNPNAGFGPIPDKYYDILVEIRNYLQIIANK